MTMSMMVITKSIMLLVPLASVATTSTATRYIPIFGIGAHRLNAAPSSAAEVALPSWPGRAAALHLAGKFSYKIPPLLLQQSCSVV
jgi:hypothetical protein